MCMEDIRLGRKTESRLVMLKVGNAVTPILGGNPRRVSLTFLPTDAGTMTYSDDGGVTVGVGIFRASGNIPYTLTIEDHGKIVQKAWFAIADAANRNAGFIEAWLAEE